VQRAEQSVARRAGLLYLANTIGAVCGSLATGFALLPFLGIQRSATVLTIAAALAMVPLSILSRERSPAASPGTGIGTVSLAGATLAAVVALVLWAWLPSGYVIRRAQVLPTGDGRVLALSEGVTEVVAVTESKDGRALLTNGHPMSGTEPLGQRYMRALAHIPLLLLDDPQNVLVIGFGVGNTTHAATLHPTVQRVDVADLSRHVLVHANYFNAANADVLSERRVSVFVNDGRQHLLMQPGPTYDLIALEPPPVAHSGVGALYSREFYRLARTRLRPGGYISQWLPVYQVPPAATTALIRAFVDVFPQAVLLSGAKADLVLLGTNAAAAEIDPDRLASALARAPAVQADLQRFSLGTVLEIVGSFIGSGRNLVDATRDAAPVTDDRPIQEYSVRSLLNTARHTWSPSASLIDLSQIPAWCPRCFVGGRPVPLVEGIDTYLTLLDRFYTGSPQTSSPGRYGGRTIAGSAYLGTVVPETSEVHHILGLASLKRGAADGAVAEAVEHFRRSVELDPGNNVARYQLATTLFEGGRHDEAMDHFRRALPSLPDAAVAYNTLGVGLASRGRLADAIDQFREAIRLRPAYVEAYNNLGTALASQGRREEALAQFQHALTLQPGYDDARRNLAIVEQGALSPGFAIKR
jgi:spermidine synthase/Flp pilus assembly protein TadD